MSSLRRLIPLSRALTLGLMLVLGLTSVARRWHKPPPPGVLITEVQAANTRTVADDQGRYSDWVELHNPTDTPIALRGYTLTDDPAAPAKWPLPVSTLAPGAFLVIWASGLDQVTPDGWHTSFRLNRAGEYVGLFDPDGQLVDEVTFWAQEADVSLGRLDTVSNRWGAFLFPTPGAANTTQHHLRAPPDAPPVDITPGSGRYAGPVTVQLYPPVPGSLLYYTLDGADPTVDGQAYTAPLELTETTVLRAVALDNGVPVSAVTTATYLVGEGTGLPVLSLVTDPAYLWDAATGIYANPEERGRSWERPVKVEWLSPEGAVGFSVGAGLRIHGGGSRLTAKKSFRLYFRGAYGTRELAYPLFGPERGQTYDRLILRAGLQDSLSSAKEAVYVRNQLVRDLHGTMGQVAARGRWGVLYLNGAHWGLYELTERIDDAFLTTHFGHDDWDVVSDEEHEAWLAFVDWTTGTDLSEMAQYEQAVQQLDIENFTSFIILELWAGDTDWSGINWYAARMRDGPDTRWRLFVWDAEATFGLDGLPSDQEVLNSGGSLIPILASLLANPQYQAYFAAEVERHLAGALATESVRGRLAALTTTLRPAIAAEAARWLPEQEPAAVVAQWEAAMQRVSDSLDASEQRLRYLSTPETLRPLLPQLSAPGPPAPLPPNTRIVLLVDPPTEVAPPSEVAKGDVAVVEHLAARGATVTVIRSSDGSAPDPAVVAERHDLILISSSIRALDGAARYAQTETPIIFWEPFLLERSPRLSPRGGPRSQQHYIRIVDADHPITAGLPTDRLFRVVRRPDTFSIAWRTSGPGVQVLATHQYGSYAILAAEAGAELSNGQPAQARTIFMYWYHDTFHRSTGEAVRLFDRAVDWALGLPSSDGA